MFSVIDRRRLLRSGALAAGGIALSRWLPAWAQSISAGVAGPLPVLSGTDIALRIAHQRIVIDERESQAIGINGTVPAPLLRLREGTVVRLSVTNELDEDSSIHWHGLLVPPQFDGVPGISFPGIRPQSTFVYEFPIQQYGTYWYHSVDVHPQLTHLAG